MARLHEGYEDLVIDRLMARGEYTRIIEMLRVELEEHPRDAWLRSRMAQALAQSGREDEARFILSAVADDCARDGSVARGIAAIKRAAKLGADPTVLEARLAATVSTVESKAVRTEPLFRSGALAHSPLFSDFTESELSAIVRGLVLRNHDAGDILVTEGESGQSLYILVDGRARVWARDQSGKNVAIRTLVGGDFFGEIALLQAGMRTATITAVCPCEVLELPRAEMEAVANRHPRIKEVLAASYRERLENPVEARIRGRRTSADH